MSTALATISPEQETAAVGGVAQAVSVVLRIATDLQVRNDAEAQQAAELLQRIAAERKAAEAARVELVKPLNDHVKHINSRFREATGPAEEADKIVRGKLLAWREEQERLRREEQARLERERQAEQRRLDEERAAAEAKARAEREAAAREAARKEAEAREAERKRAEEMARQADERARQIAAMSDDELRKLLEHPTDGQTATAELGARAAARKAQEEAAAARQREEDARLAEQAAREAPVAQAPVVQVAAPAPLASASGAVAERKVWRATVTDETRIPREYLAVDQAAINRAVRNGVRDIPGVEIAQVSELAVRAAA